MNASRTNNLFMLSHFHVSIIDVSPPSIRNTLDNSSRRFDSIANARNESFEIFLPNLFRTTFSYSFPYQGGLQFLLSFKPPFLSSRTRTLKLLFHHQKRKQTKKKQKTTTTTKTKQNKTKTRCTLNSL